MKNWAGDQRYTRLVHRGVLFFGSCASASDHALFVRTARKSGFFHAPEYVARVRHRIRISANIFVYVTSAERDGVYHKTRRNKHVM